MALAWTPEGTLDKLTHEVHGCAVSAAAASMVAQRLEGRTRAEIQTMAAAFDGPPGPHGLRGGVGRFPGVQRHREISGADPLRRAGLESGGAGVGQSERRPGMKTARFWEAAENRAVKCELVSAPLPDSRGRAEPVLRAGQPWRHVDGGDVGIAGRHAAWIPSRKSRLNHFLPGSRVLSLGTLGCNLACRFCQNWRFEPSGRGAARAGNAGAAGGGGARRRSRAAFPRWRRPTTSRRSGRSMRWTSPTPAMRRASAWWR